MSKLDDYIQFLGEQLEKDIFELDLSMPPETASIEERLNSICQWSQGFLLGYGMQLGNQKLNSEELDEALEDLMEISQVDLAVEETEEMEQALYTVIEHVRVTSQVIYLETRGQLQAALQQMQSSKQSIH